MTDMRLSHRRRRRPDGPRAGARDSGDAGLRARRRGRAREYTRLRRGRGHARGPLALRHQGDRRSHAARRQCRRHRRFYRAGRERRACRDRGSGAHRARARHHRAYARRRQQDRSRRSQRRHHPLGQHEPWASISWPRSPSASPRRWVRISTSRSSKCTTTGRSTRLRARR